ncbi:MAG: hypothetical protein ACO2PO_19015 [Candidatus Calescibacterium sp.]
MPENIIKEYPEEIVEVTEDSIKKYIEGISENNPVFLKDGVKAPPLYATALSIPFTGRVLFDFIFPPSFLLENSRRLEGRFIENEVLKFLLAMLTIFLHIL